MLETYFQGIVLTSLLGAIFALILMVIKPMTQKHFSESWHYYIWLVVLVAMLFPIRIEFPELPHNPAVSRVTMQLEAAVEDVFESVGLTESAAKNMYDEEGRRLYSPHLQEKRMREVAIERRMDRIVMSWFGVALAIFLYKVGSFHYCVKKLKKISREVDCPEIAEYTRRKVHVRKGNWGNSPLLMGVFRPILLLPDRKMTSEQLHNVLAHEMTHLRRNDMLYKWFVVLVKCIHWFNPVVYLVSGQINQSCEISCDLSVTESMSKAQKMSYVDTILALFADQKHKDYALTMGMTGSKELLKKRFLKMKNRIAVSEKMRKLSGVAATVMLIGVMAVSGGLAAKVFPDLSDQNLPPVLSDCTKCRQETLYYERVLAVKNQDKELTPYYNYLFHCEKCGNDWKEQQKVVGAYTLKYGSNQLIKVEDMMAYAEVEEVQESFWEQILHKIQ